MCFSKHKDHTNTILTILLIIYGTIKFCINGKFQVSVDDPPIQLFSFCYSKIISDFMLQCLAFYSIVQYQILRINKQFKSSRSCLILRIWSNTLVLIVQLIRASMERHGFLHLWLKFSEYKLACEDI